ncbi:hypothetical protein SAMN05421777_1385 [Fluoribacter gormanii]|uniref:Uncharacterized protein n=1 Tax=Fluoribacter gormanii TaxID=464 RepID=A0A377GGP3_9GAMM|nr:hypothetical protein SAMN05421777_1385 [Fluoribacter gormanii]STO23723.1 Uncharacterised protein [Fluoribacter gormanii]
MEKIFNINGQELTFLEKRYKVMNYAISLNKLYRLIVIITYLYHTEY